MTFSMVKVGGQNVETLHDSSRTVLCVGELPNKRPAIITTPKGKLYAIQPCTQKTISSPVHYNSLVDRGMIVWATKENHLEHLPTLQVPKGVPIGFLLKTSGKPAVLSFGESLNIDDPQRAEEEKKALKAFSILFDKTLNAEREFKEAASGIKA